jgi:uncharacterized protein YjiS (DUF1127 family)
LILIEASLQDNAYCRFSSRRSTMIAAPLSKSAVRPFPTPSLRTTWHLLDRWSARRRQRADLADLHAQLLADIGVSPQEACRECAVPFWR